MKTATEHLRKQLLHGNVTEVRHLACPVCSGSLAVTYNDSSSKITWRLLPEFFLLQHAY